MFCFELAIICLGRSEKKCVTSLNSYFFMFYFLAVNLNSPVKSFSDNTSLFQVVLNLEISAAVLS